MRRWTFVDAMRGTAILLMVIDHAYDWWLDEAGHETALARGTEFLGTLAAPSFLFLVGLGLAISFWRAVRRGQARSAIAWRMLRRGGVLVLLGYALNLAVFFVGNNPADMFAVDVLHTIGVSIWFSIPLLWTPGWGAVIAALVVALVGQVTAASWTLPTWLAAYVTGTAGISYFPVILWVPFVYLGFAAGWWMTCLPAQKGLMGVLAVVGLGLLALTAFVDPAWGYRYPRPISVLFSACFVLWLMVGLWWWTEAWGRTGPVLRAVCDMGRASLALYVLHHLIGYRLFWLFGWVHGRPWRGQYGVFRPPWATAMLVGLVLLMVWFSRLWLAWRDRTS